MLRAGTNRITVALHRHPDGGHRAFWFDMDLRLHKRAGFIKTPYLQGGDRDWVTVSWETNVAGFGGVRWGLAPDRLDRRVVAPEIAGAHHEVTLTELPPNSTIYYRAETDPVKGATARVDAPVRSFRSQPLKGETYRFIAYGDVRTNADIHAALTRRMWDDALAADARFVVNTGDLTDLGAPWDGWQREFFEPALPIMSRLPFFASLGNHEGNHESYYHYMALPGNEAWYTFERGDAAFFAINSSSEFEEGTAQWRWLDGALAASKAKWKLVFFHHPPFACTPERKPGDLRVQTHLVPLFEKHHVDLALLGHDHLYGRSRDINGVRYVITGGGGAPTYPAESDAINEVCISAHHYMVVEVAPDHLSWTATDIDGKQLDAFSLTKPPAASSPP
jgi:3',5'-cyclic AMP phosphodiesterase CpdA